MYEYILNHIAAYTLAAAGIVVGVGLIAEALSRRLMPDRPFDPRVAEPPLHPLVIRHGRIIESEVSE